MTPYTIKLTPGYASLDLRYEGSDGLTHYAKLEWVWADGTATISRGYYGKDRVRSLAGYTTMRGGELLELPAPGEHDPSGRECALAGRDDPAGCPLCLADRAAWAEYRAIYPA
jgi:hypothetical protein